MDDKTRDDHLRRSLRVVLRIYKMERRTDVMAAVVMVGLLFVVVLERQWWGLIAVGYFTWQWRWGLADMQRHSELRGWWSAWSVMWEKVGPQLDVEAIEELGATAALGPPKYGYAQIKGYLAELDGES